MNRRASRKQTSIGSWIAAIAVLIAIVAAAAYMWRMATHPETSETQELPSSASTASVKPANTAPVGEHALAPAMSIPAPASTASLPALDDSDASVQEALAALAGNSDLTSLLVPRQIIAHVVATVDALPRQGMGSRILPLRAPKGGMRIEQANGATVISASNTDRYAPYMAVLAQVDPAAMVTWYRRSYPLFEQAYRELGYPHGTFNNRLLVAIDDMLAAPEPQGPIAIAPSGMHYVLVDPQLQALSNGQKLMVRLGPSNEAAFKAKLRIIRALLAHNSTTVH